MKSNLIKISWKHTVTITLIVTIFLSYTVYYTQNLPSEEHQVITICSYNQNTNADYIANLNPNILYGETIGNSEPIYLNLVKSINTKFNYTFECSEPGQISTNYMINTEVGPNGGWSKAINDIVDILPSEKIGDRISSLEANFNYNITEILQLIEEIETNIGVSAASYQVITTININTTNVNNLIELKPPALEEKIVLTMNYVTGYMEKSGLITVELPRTYLPGELVEDSTTEISSTLQLRTATIITLIGWVSGASFFSTRTYKKEKKKLTDLPEAEQILKKYKIIEAQDMPTLSVQTLASMDSLKSVIDDYESILFHTIFNGQDVFFTSIENITYQYIVNPYLQVNDRCKIKVN